MATKTIPAVVTHVCDGCGYEKTDFKGGFDCKLTIYQVGRDFQGHAVGGNEVSRDLCKLCVKQLNAFFTGRQESNNG